MNQTFDRREYLKHKLDLENRNKILYICDDGILFKKDNKVFCITDKNILNVFDVSKNNFGKFEYINYSDIPFFYNIDIYNENFLKVTGHQYIDDFKFLPIIGKQILNYKFNYKEILQCEKIIGEIEELSVSINYPLIKVKGKYGFVYIKGE